MTRLEGVYASTSRPYTAVAAVTATWESFSFALPNNGCQDHRNVSGFFFVSFGGSSSSVASETFDCDFATNAGFFAFTPPACVGNIVAMGDQVQLPATGNVNFGTTKVCFFHIQALLTVVRGQAHRCWLPQLQRIKRFPVSKSAQWHWMVIVYVA